MHARSFPALLVVAALLAPTVAAARVVRLTCRDGIVPPLPRCVAGCSRAGGVRRPGHRYSLGLSVAIPTSSVMASARSPSGCAARWRAPITSSAYR